MATSSRGPQTGPVGARFARATPDGPPPVDPGAAPHFESVLRGYDRHQVDTHLERRTAGEQALREALADAERRLAAAVARAEATEAELRTLRAAPTATDPSSGFGQRAERLLRLAEAEASEVRTQAARDASELTARARSAAETHRHEIEQGLIARTTELDEYAAQQSAALREREEELDRQRDQLRTEAEQLTAAATRDAERIRAEAEADAERTRRRLRSEADRSKAALTGEIDRLRALRGEARASVERIVEVVSAQLGTDRPRVGAG